MGTYVFRLRLEGYSTSLGRCFRRIQFSSEFKYPPTSNQRTHQPSRQFMLPGPAECAERLNPVVAGGRLAVLASEREFILNNKLLINPIRTSRQAKLESSTVSI